MEEWRKRKKGEVRTLVEEKKEVRKDRTVKRGEEGEMDWVMDEEYDGREEREGGAGEE